MVCVCVCGGGGVRLIVTFQPLGVISPSVSWIPWCMQKYVGVGVVSLIWTCLVWAELYTPESFWEPRHQFNSATGEQKLIT